MPAYYFAMEGYHTGEKPDPAVDKLITIQYQKIDLTTGEPLGELTILKEWESSEQAILTTFYNQFFRADVPVTHFIPVGMSLDYEFEMLMTKCKKYNLPAITSHQIYFQRPRFDLRSIVVLLNDGRFAGARLDLFSSKKYDGSHMRKWYESKDFKKIEHFVREETEAVLKLLQYLSKYKTRLGIIKKEETSHGKTSPAGPFSREERTTPSRPLPSHPRSPAPSMQPARKPAETRTPAPKKSPAKLLKAEPGTSRKGSALLGKAESGDTRRPSGKKNPPLRALPCPPASSANIHRQKIRQRKEIREKRTGDNFYPLF